MKKFIRKVIIISLVLFSGLYILNSETDTLKNFRERHPVIARSFPYVATAAENISDWFSKIPSISQLGAHITNEEMPMDPDDFAENAYIKNSPLLTFYENESVGITVNNDNTVTLFGILQKTGKANIAVQFLADSGDVIHEESFAADTEYKFSKTLTIPETDSTRLCIDIYTGEKKYGNYDGLVNRYLYIEKTDSAWELSESPVLAENKKMYDKKRSVSSALISTESIESDSKSVKSVAEQLTADCSTDYEKLRVIHDWICSYVHYDTDSLNDNKIANYKATDVLRTQKAVCLGYANLYASLCRSIDIPCSVVTGYALGIDSESEEWTEKTISGNKENHAWNEAYVDGRWIIIDCTWDTFNTFENGKKNKGNSISHLYFDANIDFFSNNHRIMNYDEQ